MSTLSLADLFSVLRSNSIRVTGAQGFPKYRIGPGEDCCSYCLYGALKSPMRPSSTGCLCVPLLSVFKIYEKPILDENGVGHRYLQHDLTEPAFTPRHKGLMIVRLLSVIARVHPKHDCVRAVSACSHVVCSQASVLGLAVFVCGVPAFTFMAIKRSADKNKLDDPRCVLLWRRAVLLLRIPGIGRHNA